MTDKVSLEKVEVLLNSVLKELQKEKMRSRQLEEQLIKLANEQKHVAELDSRMLRAEQQHKTSADALASRLSSVEASVAKAAEKKLPPPPPPPPPPPRLFSARQC